MSNTQVNKEQAYVCLENSHLAPSGCKNDLNWFFINMSDGEKEQLLDFPPEFVPKKSTPVYHESCIYFIGGLGLLKTYHSHELVPVSDVHIYNTLSREWTVGEFMQVPRHAPTAVLFGRKIFVFQGKEDPSKPTTLLPWAECYDLDLNQWSNLPDPPPPVKSSPINSHSVDYSRNRIVFVNSSCLFSFHRLSHSWHFAKKFGRRNINCKLAIVEDILYWLAVDKIYGYNLRTNTILSKKPLITPYFRPHSWCGATLMVIHKKELCLFRKNVLAEIIKYKLDESPGTDPTLVSIGSPLHIGEHVFVHHFLQLPFEDEEINPGMDRQGQDCSELKDMFRTIYRICNRLETANSSVSFLSVLQDRDFIKIPSSMHDHEARLSLKRTYRQLKVELGKLHSNMDESTKKITDMSSLVMLQSDLFPEAFCWMERSVAELGDIKVHIEGKRSELKKAIYVTNESFSVRDVVCVMDISIGKMKEARNLMEEVVGKLLEEAKSNFEQKKTLTESQLQFLRWGVVHYIQKLRRLAEWPSVLHQDFFCKNQK